MNCFNADCYAVPRMCFRVWHHCVEMGCYSIILQVLISVVTIPEFPLNIWDLSLLNVSTRTDAFSEMLLTDCSLLGACHANTFSLLQDVLTLLVMPLHGTTHWSFYKYEISVQPDIAIYKSDNFFFYVCCFILACVEVKIILNILCRFLR